jgi:hypothetical protein
MEKQYKNEPCKNNIFENQILLEWFLQAYPTRREGKTEFDWCEYSGRIPFHKSEISDMIGMEIAMPMDTEELEINWGLSFPVIVVGREEWNEDDILLKMILSDMSSNYFYNYFHNKNKPLANVYSQEMFLSYAITGVDPFSASPEVLLAFAEGHPALQYLLNYKLFCYDWLSATAVGKGDLAKAQYPNNPKKNNIFENPVLLDWFLSVCTPDEEQKGEMRLAIKAVPLGNGPLHEDEFGRIINDLWIKDHIFVAEITLDELEDADISDIHTIIVGREGWDEYDILDNFVRNHIKTRQPCKIYSQEMLLAYAITGRDPFDAPREVLLAFAEGHPALQYLLNFEVSYFDWPAMEVKGGSDSDFEYDLKSEGMLGAFGYHAGKSGKPKAERHEALERAFDTPPGKLPQIKNKESLEKWRATPQGSCDRLSRIAWYIGGFLWRKDYPKYQKNPKGYRKLIDDYKSDLDWLVLSQV